MDPYRTLYEVTKQLVLAQDEGQTAEIVFRSLLEIAGADRGFIIVREDGTFRQKLDLRFDRAQVSAEERRFSRTLVREAIEKRAGRRSSSRSCRGRLCRVAVSGRCRGRRRR